MRELLGQGNGVVKRGPLPGARQSVGYEGGQDDGDGVGGLARHLQSHKSGRQSVSDRS